MKNLIEHIERKEYVEANEVFLEAIGRIVEHKLFEAKKMYAAKLSLREAAWHRGPVTSKTIDDARKTSERTKERPTDPAAEFRRIRAEKTGKTNVIKLKPKKND